MRFDAYAGTVWDSHAREVAEVVSWRTRGQARQANPRGRYGEVFEVRHGPELVGWCGTDRTLKAAYFEFKGEASPEAAGSIRLHWPDGHGVSRLDACEDYDAPGAFDELVALVDRTKADARVTSDAIVPRDGDRGQTVYWGARTSRALVRCYEKGKQKENLALNRPGWARLELQLRPGKSAEKQAAAYVNPVQAWGFARWTAQVAAAVTRVDIGRFDAPRGRPSFDKTTAYLARGYRRHFEEMLEDHGSWECLGREFEAVWRADDEAAAGSGGGRS